MKKLPQRTVFQAYLIVDPVYRSGAEMCLAGQIVHGEVTLSALSYLYRTYRTKMCMAGQLKMHNVQTELVNFCAHGAHRAHNGIFDDQISLGTDHDRF
jgi:hypothetical protein